MRDLRNGHQGETVREYSAPAMVEIPGSANLTEVVFQRADREPDTVMLRRKDKDGGWRDVTARRFREDVTLVAKGLAASGIDPGDRVALMSRTRYEWTVLDYAILTAGAITVPIYETSSAEQVEWIAGDSGAKAAFVETSDHEATFAEVRGRLPALRNVWRIGASVLDGLAKAGSDVTDEEIDKRRTTPGAADLATIIYTSGTTGRPKGCELTHGNLLADVRNAVVGALSDVFEVSGGSTLLFIPLAHVFSRIIQFGCLESGTVLGHTSTTADLLADLGSYQPTFILAVPRVFEKVYNGAEQKAAADGKGKIFRAAADAAIAYSKSLDSGGPGTGLRLKHALFSRLVYGKLQAAVGGHVRFAVSGGAALGERLGHFFRGVGITILEGYGLTETTAAATVNRPNRNKVGTVGLPLPGVAIKIADDGEILIKGPNVFTGYWHNDDATAEMLDGDWIRTGDLGSLDDEGFLSVTGRKKEIIVTAGGKNVAPAVLEDRIRAHPLISQCMVVGDGRPFVGCLITLDEEAIDHWKAQHGKPAGATIADLASDPELNAEIQTAVHEANKAVSRAESIRRFRVLRTDFTEEGGQLTPSLKVRRNVVATDFAADIEALYA
jgi:long-chain acyl-CoA synthetase